MTREEVIEKWSKKHRRALTNILHYVEKGENEILYPLKNVHTLVTIQIFHDFGYKKGKKILGDDGQKQFLKFIKKD